MHVSIDIYMQIYEGCSCETHLTHCNQIQSTKTTSYNSFDKVEETSNITNAHQFKKSCVVSSDRLCGLVNRVPGYRSRSPGSFPGTTRFSKK
jgi:hypothetical protein